jgi:hypothetical protein
MLHQYTTALHLRLRMLYKKRRTHPLSQKEREHAELLHYSENSAQVQ